MSETKNPTILRFELSVDRPFDVFNIFYPKGRHVLNRTEWRGKEPRSCAVTGLHGRPHSADDTNPTTFDVEVSYRPKGHITFVANTRYDGWTAMMLDKKEDGTLLDGHGNPLPPGQTEVYLPFEVYEDAEFNEMNFGKFIGETAVEGIKHVTYDEVMRQIQNAQHMNMTIHSEFVAPRRQRPETRIILIDNQFVQSPHSSGVRLFFVDKTAPHFTQTVFDHLYEITSGFIEGRYSIKSMSTETIEFVDLSDCIMEATANDGTQSTRSAIISSYLSPSTMEELAKRLSAVYKVDLTVVVGESAGFLMKRIIE